MLEGQYSNARNKIDNITIENVFKTKRFFIETLKGEMKPVVMGDKGGWVWMAKKNNNKELLAEFLEYQDSVATNKINGYSPQYSTSSLFKYLNRVLVGGIRIYSSSGIQVWTWSEIKKSSSPWNFRKVNTMVQETQIENSPSKDFSLSRLFSMPTLIKEKEPVVLVKYEFEYREKLKMKSFLWMFRTIRILMHERKTIVFNWIFVYKCSTSDWHFDGGHRTCGGSQLKVWISNEIKMSSTFLQYLDCHKSDAGI